MRLQGFAKGDMNDRSGQVDQDSQTAYIYSSAHFANNVFVDGSLSYFSLQQRPVCNHEATVLTLTAAPTPTLGALV